MSFTPFATWAAVREAAASGKVSLYYWAPMDIMPTAVGILRVFKNGKLRICPLANGASHFTADSGHLERFFTRIKPVNVYGDTIKHQSNVDQMTAWCPPPGELPLDRAKRTDGK